MVIFAFTGGRYIRHVDIVVPTGRVSSMSRGWSRFGSWVSVLDKQNVHQMKPSCRGPTPDDYGLVIPLRMLPSRFGCWVSAPDGDLCTQAAKSGRGQPDLGGILCMVGR
ncbi:hypothetical protein AUP68_03417 [Ilyonectria robusta]